MPPTKLDFITLEYTKKTQSYLFDSSHELFNFFCTYNFSDGLFQQCPKGFVVISDLNLYFLFIGNNLVCNCFCFDFLLKK